MSIVFFSIAICALFSGCNKLYSGALSNKFSEIVVSVGPALEKLLQISLIIGQIIIKSLALINNFVGHFI